MSATTIRTGQPGDLDALERLENTVFETDRLSRRSLRRFLSVPTTVVLVAWRDGVVVGYAMIGFRAGSRVGRIFSLAVAPDQGRRGIGRALLEASEAHAATRGCMAVRLEVRDENVAAIGLYTGAGFQQFDSEAGYYEDGATALRFEKPLTPLAMRQG